MASSHYVLVLLICVFFFCVVLCKSCVCVSCVVASSHYHSCVFFRVSECVYCGGMLCVSFIFVCCLCVQYVLSVIARKHCVFCLVCACFSCFESVGQESCACFLVITCLHEYNRVTAARCVCMCVCMDVMCVPKFCANSRAVWIVVLSFTCHHVDNQPCAACLYSVASHIFHFSLKLPEL